VWMKVMPRNIPLDAGPGADVEKCLITHIGE